MIIAVPSMGRAGAVKTLRILPAASLFVPAVEAADYKKAHPDAKVVGVPDEIKGITRTRNWILDWALRRKGGRRVVFIDDDVKTAGWIELRRESAKSRKITGEAWTAEFARLFDVAAGFGFRIWGVATDGATRSVYPTKPFVTRTYVTASCMGMINEKSFRFDESFPVKEDYEICLRCLKEDGGVLGARYLYWVNHHWTGEGGCSVYRTQAIERSAIRRLRLMYPGMIRRVERGGSGYSIELEFHVSR